MDDCCDDVCTTGDPGPAQRRALLFVLAINVVMFLAVLVAALFARSSSLLSGSIDNLGDAITYGLSLHAVSRGPRAKARVSLIKGGLILLAGLGAMTLLSLVANAACLAILWRHRGEDINMASVWECSRNDVIENLAVLVAAASVWLTAAQWPDTVVAVALVAILFRSAFRIVRRSLAEMRRG
jgi:Co/Zn/Cd efflux system component